MLHMLCTERDGHSRACRIRNDVVVVMVVVAVSRLAYPHSTSTVFAYPGGNAAISYLFRASLRCLNSYAYEPFKLSLCLLPRVQGSLCRAAGLPLSSGLFFKSEQWLARWGLNSSPPPAVCTSPHYQRPVPDGFWRTAALLTTRASCRVKLLRGICMCLPR